MVTQSREMNDIQSLATIARELIVLNYDQFWKGVELADQSLPPTFFMGMSKNDLWDFNLGYMLGTHLKKRPK